MEVPPVPDCSDGASALQADLDLEERQLQRYRDRVTEAADLGLPDVPARAAFEALCEFVVERTG